MNREHVFFDMFEPHPFHKSTLNLFILIQTTGFCVNSSSNMATMRWRSADFVFFFFYLFSPKKKTTTVERCHTKTDGQGFKDKQCRSWLRWLRGSGLMGLMMMMTIMMKHPLKFTLLGTITYPGSKFFGTFESMMRGGIC